MKYFLEKQPAYTLHKNVRKRFKRRKILAKYGDHIWEIDLIDLQAISAENRGNRYVLTVRDVLSRFALAQPIKDKKSSTIIEAFKKLFRLHNRKPTKNHSDCGKEFTSKEFTAFLRKQGVVQYSTFSENKAAIIGRFNRTIKSKIHRYFTAKKTLHYLKALPQFIRGYNNKVHRSHGFKPSHVNKKNYKRVWEALYGNYMRETVKKPRFVRGDFVRLSKLRGIFIKAYIRGWTTEIFIIHDIIKTNPVTYRIRDQQGEILQA